MNLRNAIQLQEVSFLSGSDHRGKNVAHHPNVCIQVNSLVLSVPSFLQHLWYKAHYTHCNIFTGKHKSGHSWEKSVLP